MKKFVFIIVLVCLSTSLYGQRMNKERVKLLKTSFITDALELSPSEAEKFWPIYNLYSEKVLTAKNKIERQIIGKFLQTNKNFDISEQESSVLVSKIAELESEVVNNQQLMYSELSGIISSKKIFKLIVAEREFNRRILQEFGKRARMNRKN